MEIEIRGHDIVEGEVTGFVKWLNMRDGRGIKEDSEDSRSRISLFSLSDLEGSIIYRDWELRKRNRVLLAS